MVKNQFDPAKSSKTLRDRALASGSMDNISVIVIQLTESPKKGSRISPKNKSLLQQNEENSNQDEKDDNTNDINGDKGKEEDREDSVVIREVDDDSDLDSDELERRKIEREKEKNLKKLEEGDLFI